MNKGQNEIFSKFRRIHEALSLVFGKYGIFICIPVVLLALSLVLHDSIGLLWEHRPLPGAEMHKGIGYSGELGYSIPLGTTWMSHDKRGTSAPAQVLEDGVPLAYPDSLHADIADKGAGRYSLWGGTLNFSTSDNTDPRTNSRKYELYWPVPVTPVIIWMIYILAIFMTLYNISYYWKNIRKLVYRFLLATISIVLMFGLLDLSVRVLRAFNGRIAGVQSPF